MHCLIVMDLHLGTWLLLTLQIAGLFQWACCARSKTSAKTIKTTRDPKRLPSIREILSPTNTRVQDAVRAAEARLGTLFGHVGMSNVKFHVESSVVYSHRRKQFDEYHQYELKGELSGYLEAQSDKPFQLACGLHIKGHSGDSKYLEAENCTAQIVLGSLLPIRRPPSNQSKPIAIDEENRKQFEDRLSVDLLSVLLFVNKECHVRSDDQLTRSQWSEPKMMMM